MKRRRSFWIKMCLEHKIKGHLLILESKQRHQQYAKQTFALKIFRAQYVFVEVNEEPPSPRR
jgi:hypothetical protein